MVGIVFFRRVVLEDAEGLLSKVKQLNMLLSALGWASSHQEGGRSGKDKANKAGSGGSGNRLLAACLEPPAKARLAALHQAAESGGELRANFQVCRSAGAAFWEAKKQAEEAGLIQLKEGSARPKCYKVFPSFVDEWANSSGTGGSGDDGRKIKVEAGEGHGPRKEFFSLAAASMTGGGPQPKASIDDPSVLATPSSISLQRKDNSILHPQLFLFNRSAGAFWYNTTLTSSPELQGAFRFAGWLVGQSLLNKAPLGVPLAPVMLQQLLLEGGIDAYHADLEALEVSK